MKLIEPLRSACLLGALVLAVGGCSSTGGPGRGSGGLGGRGSLARNAANLGIRVDLIPEGRYGRHLKRPMRPRFITVHATETYGSSANAATMARALRNGNLTATHNLLGYLTWHFSVDQGSVYQSLPLNERGEHADYEGQGNKESIGIEMCENRGNSITATVDRTAKLCAVLMAEYGIPLQNVVPHYHWEQIRPRTGKNLGHKSCPHFLMDNGKPGAKWQGFLRKVDGYSKQLKRTGRA
jgi:N-acetylmuramoyl-L-alanine amidase